MAPAKPAVIMLYRSLLRWTNRAPMRDAVFDLPLLDNSLAARWPKEPPRNAAGVAAAVRAAFRDPTIKEDEGVSQAFELLRALDGYTENVESLAEQRADHSDRSGVEFSVGQVLRHKQFAFRGIIFGWDRRPIMDVSNWDGMNGVSTDQPFYHVLPDSSDCMAFLGGPRESRYVAQSNLTKAEISSLEKRVSSPFVRQFFAEYDPAAERYVPLDSHKYLYPDPAYTAVATTALAEDAVEEGAVELAAAEARVSVVVETVAEIVLDAMSSVPALASERTSLSAAVAGLQSEESQISELSNAGGLADDIASGTDKPSALVNVLWLLRDVIAQLDAALTKRAKGGAAAREEAGLEFTVGQLVLHGKYNFRGVVMGYDERPVMDVSRWDGVQDLPSGGDQPFYHVLPDDDDCIAEFGAQRTWRYCAQENLLPLEIPPGADSDDPGFDAEEEDEQTDPSLAAALKAAGLTLPGTTSGTASDGGMQIRGGTGSLPGLSAAPERFQISHAQLTNLFDRYDAERGRYIPAEQLRYQYPELDNVYHDADSEEARADALAANGRAAVMDAVHVQLSKAKIANGYTDSFLDDMYVLLGASRDVRVGEVLQQTISYLNGRVGVSSTVVEALTQAAIVDGSVDSKLRAAELIRAMDDLEALLHKEPGL